MKKILFSGIAVFVIGAITFMACKRGFNDKFEDRSTVATTTPNCTSCVSTGTDTLRGVLVGNRTLTCNTTYILDGKYYVNNGATLTIDAGTTIKAIRKTFTDEASAIVVTRGGKIIANGTQTCPIAFTSNEITPQPGDWGGIVLLGKATVNKVNPIVSGINLLTVPPGVDIHYGGTDDTDNSGSLVYVRIEYAGLSVTTGSELSAFTCAGVGNTTVLDFIQVYKGGFDGYRFLGGAVNAKHLYAYAAYDDAFEFSLGYIGRIQFAISALNGSVNYSPHSYGFDSGKDAVSDIPYTVPVLCNFTIVGFGDGLTATNKGILGGSQIHGGGGYLHNSLIMGYPIGIRLPSGGGGGIQLNTIHYFDLCSTSTLPPSNTCSTSLSSNTYIKLKNPFVHPNPDFRPDTGSPALGTANFTSFPLPTGNNFTFTTVTYRGAFAGSGVGANWIAGWTK